MHGLLLQDWITIRGQNDQFVVTQGADCWIDLGDFEDLVLCLDVREISSTAPTMVYETSPVRQDASFLTMRPAFTCALGTRIDRVFTSTAAVPPAKYVRWKLKQGSAPWDITFRLWLSAYAWTK